MRLPHVIYGWVEVYIWVSLPVAVVAACCCCCWCNVFNYAPVTVACPMHRTESKVRFDWEENKLVLMGLRPFYSWKWEYPLQPRALTTKLLMHILIIHSLETHKKETAFLAVG